MGKQMGPFQLSGLIVGAVLGSGIILLPPIAQNQLGQWSVTSWFIIMMLGAIFALVFAKLALEYPGSEGVPIAVCKAFGPRVAQLVSNYLICAVCVGPIVVLMTAADTISRAFLFSPDDTPAITAGVLLFSVFLLMRRITIVGAIALATSIGIGFVLVAGSITTIALDSILPLPETHISISAMGRTLLILFWAIVGWEVIGNYTEEIHNSRKTIIISTVLSVLVIAGIYILVAWALATASAQSLSGGIQSVSQVVTPLFGSYADLIVMGMTSALCICTYLMFVGGVSRLVVSLAQQGKLPILLAKKNANGAPVGALAFFVCAHCLSLALLSSKVVTLEDLVAMANVFFLANSLLAVLSAMYLFPSLWFRISCAFLCFAFISLLYFSSFLPLAGLLLVSLLTFCPFQLLRASSTN